MSTARPGLAPATRADPGCFLCSCTNRPCFCFDKRDLFCIWYLPLSECCPRPHRHAPESTTITLLPSILPYCESGIFARSASVAHRISAGVSRKSVHLFRWGSYFHKAFTGTKTTPSRERLPNLLVRWQGLPAVFPAAPVRWVRPDPEALVSLYIRPSHPLLTDLRTARTCQIGGRTPTGYRVLLRTENSPSVFDWPPAIHRPEIETPSSADLAAKTLLRNGGLIHRFRNKEHPHGPTHC